MKSFFKILYIALGIVCLSNTQGYATHLYGGTLSVCNISYNATNRQLTFDVRAVIASAIFDGGSNPTSSNSPFVRIGLSDVSASTGTPVNFLGISNMLSPPKVDSIYFCGTTGIPPRTNENSYNKFTYTRRITITLVDGRIPNLGTMVRFHLLHDDMTNPSQQIIPLAARSGAINGITNVGGTEMPIYVDFRFGTLSPTAHLDFADPVLQVPLNCQLSTNIVGQTNGTLAFRPAETTTLGDDGSIAIPHTTNSSSSTMTVTDLAFLPLCRPPFTRSIILANGTTQNTTITTALTGTAVSVNPGATAATISLVNETTRVVTISNGFVWPNRTATALNLRMNYTNVGYSFPYSSVTPLGPSYNGTATITNGNSLNITIPYTSMTGGYLIAMRYTANGLVYNFEHYLRVVPTPSQVQFSNVRNVQQGVFTSNTPSSQSFEVNSGDNLSFDVTAAGTGNVGLTSIPLSSRLTDASGTVVNGVVVLNPNEIPGNSGKVTVSLPSLAEGVYTLTLEANSVSCGVTCSFQRIFYTINVVRCNCLPTFKPVPNKKYVVSAWLKWENLGAPSTSCSFEDGKGGVIGILIDGVRYPDQFRPTGEIVEGWQRIMGEFTIPAPYSSFELELVGSSNANYNALFDDLRIHPFDGSFKSYVYDDVTGKLTEELDENNYFTKYEYDQSGALERVKKETQRGVMMVQESRFGNQKKTQ